jgi:hypothetical protein
VPNKIFDDAKQGAARGGDVAWPHATHGNPIDLLGERHQLFLQSTAFCGQQHIDFLAVAATLAPDDVAQALHCIEGGKGCRLHHAGLLAQLALGQTIALPQNAQERPMSERN